MQSCFDSFHSVAHTIAKATVTLAFVAASGAVASAHDHGNHFGFGHGYQRDNQPSVYLNRDVHPTATNNTCSSPQLWQGAGNAATTFQRKRDVDAGVELALKGVLRSVVGDFNATYVDNDGVVHIEVPSGSQTSPSAQPNRAKWNFAYSVDVGLNGGNPTLDKYDVELWLDTDPSERTDYYKLKLIKYTSPAPAPVNCTDSNLNGFGWQDRHHLLLIGDDEGSVAGPTALQVTQNSENIGFGFWHDRIDADRRARGLQPYMFTPGQFDVMLSIRGPHVHDMALHVVFDVVDSPTQTP